MKCTKCEHETDSKFCPECGTKEDNELKYNPSNNYDETIFKDEETPTVVATKNIDNSNKNRIKIYVSVFLILFFVIAIIVSSCDFDTSTNSNETIPSVTIANEKAKKIEPISLDTTVELNQYVYKVSSDWEIFDDNKSDNSVTYILNDDIFIFVEYEEHIFEVFEQEVEILSTAEEFDYLTNDRYTYGVRDVFEYSYYSEDGYSSTYSFFFNDCIYRFSICGDKSTQEYIDKVLQKVKHSIDFNLPKEESTTTASNEKETKVTTIPEIVFYKDGHYKVGVDIPAGTYIAYPTDGWGGYYCISSDANGDDIIANQNFDGQDYFTVTDGQYLKLSRCKAYTLGDKKEIDYSSGYLCDGEYLVGVDIPAGEYKIYATEDIGGYYSLNSDANGEDIISNDNFENSIYITITSGCYLELSRSKIELK